LETGSDRGNIKEYVGNLFAITQSYKISNWEKKILNAFGQQAAAGLRNVKLYQRIQELYKETEELYNKAENRRKAAEIFGKMAFTASASVHALNNYMSVIKGTLQILKSEENESLITPALKTADNVVSLIENFHEPGKLQKDTLVDVNACIGRAAERTFGINIPWIRLTLSSKLMVKTIPEMLTEAFKVLIENANQAMSNESVPEEKRLLEIESKLVEEMVVVTVEDHGAGLEPENLSKIFEIRFTTKESGLGFGLFWTKDYIEGLGGSIFVESVIGMGTKFTISLPAATRESL
jgi:signal transduction histidine kinase